MRGHLGLSALLLALEHGTSFSLLSLLLYRVSKYPMLRGGERTERKRAEGATRILIVSVQCRFFIVFPSCLHREMLPERFPLPIHLFKHLLVDQFGLASTLAESRPGMFPK